MFKILNDKTICVTRGDVANIVVTANLQDGQTYLFSDNDVVRFRVFRKRDCESVVIQKDVMAEAGAEFVTIRLTREDTKIGDLINKPTSYWYEIEINPDTEPQTIIGYDEDGEKIFKLYPEGGDI